MIEVKNISFSYDRHHPVLKDVNLSVTKGESLGITGPNGAGKTTFFYLLCGILIPDSGEIKINGKAIKGAKFNPEAGFVFQNPDDQLFNISVYEDIAFGPVNMGLDKNEVHKRSAEAMKITGITHLAERPPHHLSGGERRMAAIASVISMNPGLMIYDEPTSNLDMRGRRRVIDFINSSEHTNLIASHDLEFILETCERVIIIDEKGIVKDGGTSSVMYNEKLMLRHGLERPHSLLHKKKEHVHDH
jgi:cobalt/nickel transport system ATP-binding protein